MFAFIVLTDQLSMLSKYSYILGSLSFYNIVNPWPQSLVPWAQPKHSLIDNDPVCMQTKLKFSIFPFPFPNFRIPI